MRFILALLVSFSLAAPAQAIRLQEKHKDYLNSNLLAIFYHELGHALIDVMKLPIFGQEEDAADVLSVFLIDALWDGETAIKMAYHTADGFLGEAKNRSGRRTRLLGCARPGPPAILYVCMLVLWGRSRCPSASRR